MKKVLVSLLVLALCAPAIADVTVKAASNGDGTFNVTMDVTGDSVVRGIALKVVCTGGGLADLSYAADSRLNTFIDYFATNGVGEVAGATPNQEGHPYASAAGAGVAAVSDTEFVICEGALDAAGTQGGIGAGTDILVATVSVDASEVCITLEDVDRGGIVGDDLGTVTVDGTCCPLTLGPPTPPCWGYSCFTKGDANGDCLITFGDLNALIGAWAPNPYAPCADFNKDGLITFGDLNTLIGSWPPNPNCDPGCVAVSP